MTLHQTPLLKLTYKFSLTLIATLCYAHNEANILQILHLPTSFHNVEISPKLTRNEPNPISKQRRRIIQIRNYTGNLWNPHITANKR